MKQCTGNKTCFTFEISAACFYVNANALFYTHVHTIQNEMYLRKLKKKKWKQHENK